MNSFSKFCWITERWFFPNHPRVPCDSLLIICYQLLLWSNVHWRDSCMKLKESGSYSFPYSSADTGHRNTRIKFFFQRVIFKINVELSDCSYLWNASSQWFSVCWKFLTSNKKNISFDARFDVIKFETQYSNFRFCYWFRNLWRQIKFSHGWLQLKIFPRCDFKLRVDFNIRDR